MFFKVLFYTLARLFLYAMDSVQCYKIDISDCIFTNIVVIDYCTMIVFVSVFQYAMSHFLSSFTLI